jgi:PTS system N-acetylglucosamine-specific IIC component
MMKYLQKLGKALMLPVAVLPICGILMGIGYALAPAVMGAEGATSGAAYTIGFLLIKAGGALIDNMAWLFAIGAAVGLADNDGTAGLAGLVSFLMMQQLLNPGVVGMVRHLEEGTATYIAFQKVAGNSFIGILAAVVGAACYNKFKDTQMPDWLAFFSGKRFVAIATGLISILVSVVLLFVWPVIFDGLVAIGTGIAGMGGIGAGIYAFLNRLLIPTGLHHALNNVFWFDTIGLGDLNHFWAGDVTGQNGVTWSLGMYMSGFFPCMMFGIAGAALAMVKTAKNKKAAIGLVVSAAICAFVCGVTEPFEFGFMFLCFPLYVVYSALYGIFTIITYYSGFRAGFCFSAGATDLVFSASLPAAAKTWMIIPLGIAAFVVFYFVFYFAITKFDLKTPGREDEDAEEAEKKVTLANNNYTEVASAVLAAVGGKENVKEVGYCATRLRFEVLDNAKVDEKAVKAAGAAGVIRPSKNACQVIIGTKVQFVYDELKKML